VNSNLIDLTLKRDVNSLYADLAKETGAIVRTPSISPAELVREGQKRFQEISRKIRGLICSESLLGLLNNESNEKDLAIVLIDAINSNVNGIDFPVVTVACLIAKVGINRFCQSDE